VTAYSLPLSDFGSGPIVATITLSKAFIGMYVLSLLIFGIDGMIGCFLSLLEIQ